jgi:hypothetical protein
MLIFRAVVNFVFITVRKSSKRRNYNLATSELDYSNILVYYKLNLFPHEDVEFLGGWACIFSFHLPKLLFKNGSSSFVANNVQIAIFYNLTHPWFYQTEFFSV